VIFPIPETAFRKTTVPDWPPANPHLVLHVSDARYPAYHLLDDMTFLRFSSAAVQGYDERTGANVRSREAASFRVSA
jgi:hypothetical protein